MPTDTALIDVKSSPSAKARKRLAKDAYGATATALRVMVAIIGGQTEKAGAALYYYKNKLGALVGKYKGCKASSFSSPKKIEKYAGVYVSYQLRHPDGTVTEENIALRNDNADGEWMADGGI